MAQDLKLPKSVQIIRIGNPDFSFTAVLCFPMIFQQCPHSEQKKVCLTENLQSSALFSNVNNDKQFIPPLLRVLVDLHRRIRDGLHFSALK
jgi:hypothetical protein